MDGQPSISLERREDARPAVTSVSACSSSDPYPRTAPVVGETPWWAEVSAGAAPTLLVGGFFLATALQPASYNPVHDTISSLAAQGATDPWVMTTALTGVGICYLLTALGLRPARRVGRVALAGGGIATLLIAAFRQPHHGYSLSHALAVVVASTTMCAWPLLAAHRRHPAPLLTLRASVTAVAVTSAFMMWFAFELHRADLGLAERCAAVAAALWLFPVVFTTRRAVAPDTVLEPSTARDHPRSQTGRAGAPSRNLSNTGSGAMS